MFKRNEFNLIKCSLFCCYFADDYIISINKVPIKSYLLTLFENRICKLWQCTQFELILIHGSKLV